MQFSWFMDIKKIDCLPSEIIDIVLESESEGFRFVRRLVNEYASGGNNFSAEGEALFAVRRNGVLIGVGGVNVQPGGDSSVGRLRHVYISKSARGLGFGKKLISVIESHSRPYFNKLVLFTNFENSIGFYEYLNYRPVNLPKVSHQKKLT